jgi:hypothetical protein
MIYITINEKKKKGKTLLKFLKGIDEQHEFIGFIDEEKEMGNAIIDAMNTPRVKSGNSLREILSADGL